MMTTSTPPDNRWLRQSGILSRELITEFPVTIVGIGAGGYAAARTLAVMGVPKLKLIDPDTIEDVNLGAQGWGPCYLGRSKIGAAMEELEHLNPQLECWASETKFQPKRDGQADVIFCCVDSMEARQQIWKASKDHCKFFVDGRMSGEYLEMYTVTGDNDGFELYEGTLFSDAEAYQDGCTQRTTFYCANLAAAIMVSRYSKWLRGLDVPFKLSVDLMADEMYRG